MSSKKVITIEKTNELRSLNSPSEKAKAGETDKEGESKETENLFFFFVIFLSAMPG